MENNITTGLYIVATPIGNLEDISLRAIKILKNVELILCENPANSAKLLKKYEIQTRYQKYDDHSDEKIRKNILDHIKSGKSIALISDAGMPLISDPGYKLVRDLRENNQNIYVIPGANAALTALTGSGFATDKFYFAGFAPRTSEKRKNLFENLAKYEGTLIFYESPNRVKDFLKDAEPFFSEKKVAICRELTKLFEEFIIADAKDIAKKIDAKLKGEIVILIENGKISNNLNQDELEKFLKKLMQHMSSKDAAQIASEYFALAKKEIYKIAMEIKN